MNYNNNYSILTLKNCLLCDFLHSFSHFVCFHNFPIGSTVFVCAVVYCLLLCCKLVLVIEKL